VIVATFILTQRRPNLHAPFANSASSARLAQTLHFESARRGSAVSARCASGGEVLFTLSTGEVRPAR
jgi:hypothetical protein